MNPVATMPGPTARFSVVVAKCGRPAVHLTLVDPAKDPALRRLDRQGRVMTIHPVHRGGGAEYGVVGMRPERGAQLLVFPRPLRRFAGRRIVGIKYDLLDAAPLVPGRVARATPRAVRNSRPAAGPSPAAPRAPAPPPPPPPPPDPAEILAELRKIDRLLATRKTAVARQRLHALAERIPADPAPA
jgi:hypothetical protein